MDDYLKKGEILASTLDWSKHWVREVWSQLELIQNAAGSHSGQKYQ
jgi:hypothetical protein